MRLFRQKNKVSNTADVLNHEVLIMNLNSDMYGFYRCIPSICGGYYVMYIV